MLNSLIQLSLRHRVIVLALSLLVILLGIQAGRELPVEVLPDLTKPTVVILTEAQGLAPEEVEVNVTMPIERAIMGVSGLTRLRSNSDVSLSLVYAEFGWGTDIYRARQFIQERLQSARESLPEGVEPFLTPVASLMGEILLVGLRSTNESISPVDVRTLADWTVRPRLQSIPGIAEVLNMGGGVKQVHVLPDPVRMQAYGVTYEELEQASKAAASNSTGGFIESGPTEIMVRNLAMTIDLNAVSRTMVKRLEDRSITISDVASVEWGREPMRGDGSVNGTRGVIMSITKAPGFDTLELTAQIEKALAELRPAFPGGVEALVLFKQADFIEHAIGNLKEAIRDGAIMVTIILFLFLLNVRTTLITLMAMPLSFAVTLLTFKAFGISVNSMTLGGLAVAIGMVVDDAIVDVENVFRRLRENSAKPNPLPRLNVIASASAEVRHSILYATVLIILVFLPLLGLSGLEGRLFSPIAMATIISMVASFIVSLTAIPALCSVLLRPGEKQIHNEGRLVSWMKKLLERTLLRLALNQPVLILALVGILVLGAAVLYPQMAKDFLPAFQEETVLISTTAAPGTSRDQMNLISDVIEQELLQIPEVEKVGRRLGRAERGDHVVPVSTSEFDVDFKPAQNGKPYRGRAEVLAEIRSRIKSVPGTFSVVTGPLADRIGHMLSGVSAPVAIKVFGPDLEQLRGIGLQLQTIARTIPGFEDARLDQQSTIPQLRIEPRREKLSAYGIAPGELNDKLSALLGGRLVAQLREGQRTLDLVIRLPEHLRNSPDRIAQLPVELHRDENQVQYVALSTVAEVREGRGPNVIFRENNQRRFTVAIKPTVRDVGAQVLKLQQQVAAQIKLPEGYFISYEGEFQAREAATKRIALLSIIILLAIGMMLYGYFKSPFFAVQVISDIPLALTGGLLFTSLMLNNISIATLVGFIAVAGVAARNSIMLISHYIHLMRHEGEGFTKSMIIRGTQERLVPVLMTALSAGIGLIPLVLAANQPGKEILHPVAVVIVGGLVTSTLLGLAVTPAVFFAFGRKPALKVSTIPENPLSDKIQ